MCLNVKGTVSFTKNRISNSVFRGVFFLEYEKLRLLIVVLLKSIDIDVEI